MKTLTHIVLFKRKTEVHPAYLALVVILKAYFDWAACDYTLD